MLLINNGGCVINSQFPREFGSFCMLALCCKFSLSWKIIFGFVDWRNIFVMPILTSYLKYEQIYNDNHRMES